MADALARYFEAIGPLLRGEQTPEQFEARLGRSPSGGSRLAVYPRLVFADIEGAMNALYPGVRRALETIEPGAWNRVLHEFAARHPARHWDINRFGEPFAGFLAERRARDAARTPPFLEELADFQWCEYVAYTWDGPLPDPGSRVNPTLAVRQYTHAVPGWGRRSRAGNAAGLPAKRQTTVLLFRDPRTLRVRTIYPTVAALLVLASAQQIGSGELIARSGISAEELASADQELVREGVLSAAPPTRQR